MAKRSRLLLPALILPLSLASSARADSTPADKAAATVLFNDAKKLLAEGRSNDACPKFEESQRIDPTPGTLLNLGDCYERSTPPRTASAWGTFKRAEVMARNARDKDRQECATKRMLALEPTLSKVTIRVAQDARVTGLAVKWDGKAFGDGVWGSALPVDAGEHAIEAAAPGKKVWTASVRVAATAGTMTVDVPVLAPHGLGVASVEILHHQIARVAVFQGANVQHLPHVRTGEARGDAGFLQEARVTLGIGAPTLQHELQRDPLAQANVGRRDHHAHRALAKDFLDSVLPHQEGAGRGQALDHGVRRVSPDPVPASTARVNGRERPPACVINR